MRKQLIPLLLAAVICLIPALSAAEGTVTIWGLVVNTDFGLVLKDGDTEYLLLDVEQDPATLEGKTCEVTGTKTNSLGIDSIKVETIEVIGDTSSMNYTSMNLQRGERENRLA
jgi:DNA/RNA endonuclease YhcR with UshA esterase domain